MATIKEKQYAQDYLDRQKKIAKDPTSFQNLNPIQQSYIQTKMQPTPENPSGGVAGGWGNLLKDTNAVTQYVNSKVGPGGQTAGGWQQYINEFAKQPTQPTQQIQQTQAKQVSPSYTNTSQIQPGQKGTVGGITYENRNGTLVNVSTSAELANRNRLMQTYGISDNEYQDAINPVTGEISTEYLFNKNKSLLEKQIEDTKAEQARQKEIEDIQYNKSKESAKSYGAGVESQFGGVNREGFQSVSAPLINEQFQTNLDNQMRILDVQRQSAQANRDNIMQRLEQAKKDNDIEAVSRLSKEFNQSQAIVQENEYKAAQLAKETAAQQQSFKMAEAQLKNQQLNSFSNEFGNLAPGTFSSMSPEDLAVYGAQYGLSPVQMESFKNLDIQRQQLQQSDPDYLTKQANLKYAQQKALDAGKTEFELILGAYDRINAVNPEMAELFKQINITNPARQQQQELQVSELQYQEAMNKMLDEYGIAGATNPNLQILNQNQVEFKTPPVGSVYGQCGEFFNDFLGDVYARHIGDSYESKAMIANSNTPVAGGAFIMKTNTPYGHIGLITQTFADGSFAFKDSNRNGDQTIQTGIVSAEQARMMKFFDPNKVQSAGQKKMNEAIQEKIAIKQVDQMFSKTDTANNFDQFSREQAAMSVIPVQLRNSDAEKSYYSQGIKKGLEEGKTPYEIADVLMGYNIKNKDQFSENIRSKFGNADLQGSDITNIARNINSGNKEAALRTVENAVMSKYNKENAGMMKSNEAMASLSLKRGNELENYINKLPNSPIGVVGGTVENWLGRLKGKEAQNIATQITSLSAKLRNELLGSAVTPSESSFLEPLIPNLSDSPDNFMIKLNKLKTIPLQELNSIRESVNLPKLDNNTLLDIKKRINLYGGETTTSTADSLRSKINNTTTNNKFYTK